MSRPFSSRARCLRTWGLTRSFLALLMAASTRSGVSPGVVAGELVHDFLDGPQPVGLVVDRESGVEPHEPGVDSQQPGAEAVEGAHPDARVGNERLDPLAHLAGGLVGEGDGQDLLRAIALTGAGERPAG